MLCTASMCAVQCAIGGSQRLMYYSKQQLTPSARTSHIADSQIGKQVHHSRSLTTYLHCKWEQKLMLDNGLAAWLAQQQSKIEKKNEYSSQRQERNCFSWCEFEFRCCCWVVQCIPMFNLHPLFQLWECLVFYLANYYYCFRASRNSREREGERKTEFCAVATNNNRVHRDEDE